MGDDGVELCLRPEGPPVYGQNKIDSPGGL